ncbi:MAG: hypothetical protein HYU66_05570 [Armatimonadetes bacterium]|nr:hypothetical protein [Armatimonadota bacterium]
MRPAVLIVEDSPSTADLARVALDHVACDVEVADDADRALELARSTFSPRVLVIDPYLPGVHPQIFIVTLHQAVPGAAMVLLLERAVPNPELSSFSLRMFKPLQPRRFATLVAELLNKAKLDAGEGADG